MNQKLLRKCSAISATIMVAAFSAPVFATNYVTVTQLQVVPAASWPTTVTVYCPAGYMVTGGGFSEINSGSNSGGGSTQYLTPQNYTGYIINPNFTIYASRPTDTGDGWQVNGQVSIVSSANVSVYAICASSG
ncbi:hypothetical protein [Oleiagrimonas soli]|uniref:Spore coat protein U domain-containing protein n=1 Tax=Oleiagrimonas soli TaxID=1543381 RepID=A0A841KD43_9GAMM|nr:hypothetical protein [Oleiagrimonas soli]MBB6183533.1 hypothetical protein [Oleiagrimonas soli]